MKDLLRGVSRSFYLTLRVLPHSIRPQLSIAYLLARASDTIADTEWIPASRRLEVLLQIRECIRKAGRGEEPELPDLRDLIRVPESDEPSGNPAERALLENLGNVLNVLRGFSADDRGKISLLLDIITQGQESDLRRFHDATAERIRMLDTHEELDAYTYQVAGCVGEFWTRMCRAHVFPHAVLDDSILLADSVLFGKGLQLTNILRDLPRDLRQGRCYVPREELSKHNLKAEDLLRAETMGRFRPVLENYIRQAEDHLAAGWKYTMMLPFRSVRVRLACSWPILIGVRTLDAIRRGNILDERVHVRISQSQTWGVLLRTVLYYPIPRLWQSLLGPVAHRGLKQASSR